MAATRRDRAVTLIELLVTLAVVAVLAAVAVPGYRAQLLRAHRTEAIEALVTAAAAQERYFFANGRYADAFAATAEGGLPLPGVSAGGRYRLTLEAAAGAGYEVRAVPERGKGQEDDRRCAAFSLAGDGRRHATDALGGDSTAECWR